jgi:hypothetical protein
MTQSTICELMALAIFVTQLAKKQREKQTQLNKSFRYATKIKGLV